MRAAVACKATDDLGHRLPRVARRPPRRDDRPLRFEEITMKIAFFGAGLMGSGFVRRLVANGHEVQVWNRTPAKAQTLEAHGARAFAETSDALAEIGRAHV